MWLGLKKIVGRFGHVDRMNEKEKRLTKKLLSKKVWNDFTKEMGDLREVLGTIYNYYELSCVYLTELRT